MQKSPFKFLDSFTKEDREIFFGRDKEIEELHSRVFESKILLVYGTSGTGKSSLINCGLANRFNDADWLPVSARRGKDINLSIAEALSKAALTRAPFDKALKPGNTIFNLEKLLRSVYLDHFKPIFLILDQFEELFIFGNKEEKAGLIKSVARVIDSDIQCRFIFSIREEYLAGVTEFEKVIPSFLSNRMRIEKMTRHNAIDTIEGPCRVINIDVEPGFAEGLLERLNPDSPEVELTWLQVFLDKAYRTAAGQDGNVKRLNNTLLESLGDVKDILGSFLDEQISKLDDPETGLIVLKSFVSVKGTKLQISENEVIEYTGTFGKQINTDLIRELIQKFISLRILRDKDENDRYELRHDSLASKIFEKITLVEKELLEIKYFIENAYLNFEKRKLLLSEDDLNYIAPYEDKLYLGDKYLGFIAHSKAALHRTKRRRQNILIVSAAVIFAVLSFFTIWAMKERSNAIDQQQAAETLKNEAVTARDEAENARQEAIIQRSVAETNAREAQEARQQSDLARQEAMASREDALMQKTRAEGLSAIANEQARAAEREKQFAEEQRIVAQAAEEKARKLSLLSTAQNLALRSMSADFTPENQGLMAVQAFKFNFQNGGAVNDPAIYKALEHAFNLLDRSKQSIYSGPAFEIRTLAESPDGLLGADMEGNILKWDISGKESPFPNSPLPSYIDYVSLSPDGNNIITCYENNRLILKSLSKSSTESDLKGHNSPIRTATWSDDGKYLATGGNDSLIILWNIGMQPASALKTFKTASAIKSLAFSGSDTLFSVNSNGTISLWNVNNPTNELLFSSKNIIPTCIAWNKQKNVLMAGCSDGTVALIHLSGKPSDFLLYAGSKTGITSIAFNKDCSLMCTASSDKVIKLYNYHEYFEALNISKGVINIDNIRSQIRSLIFTDDNKLIAGMSDKTIRIWETSSHKLALMICKIINKDMTIDQWNNDVGSEIPYENTCGIPPLTTIEE